MHYVPESAREFFQESERNSLEDDRALADVAGLYVLTALVGLLLAADAVLGAVNLPGGEWYRAPFGYRLALFAAVLGGARILYHSLDNLLAGRFGADLALTIACLAAIALGEHQTAGLVVFISLVGEAVEGFTLYQAKRAIRRSFQERPQTATLIKGGVDREIAVAELQPGDQILVRAGERIPADGRILTGASSINESPFTGESLPVEKSANDVVWAGSTNLTAAFTMTVERTGENTSQAEMERVVRQAAGRKMQCMRLADRFAQWFLPAVLGVAAVTLLAWRWQSGTWQAGWMPALGVLVVACPCPLVLATPCAVTASLAWLARRGIVVKGSAALERLTTVDVFAFDKTGTLSEGDLTLGDVISLSEFEVNQLLQFAASAERPSAHPIARLLRTAAAPRGLPVFWPEEFASQTGGGISARVCLTPSRAQVLAPGESPGADGVHAQDSPVSTTPPATGRGLRRVLVGSERWLVEQQIEIFPPAHEQISRIVQAGQTPLLIAVDGRLAGLIAVQEMLRAESAATLRELKSLGIRQFALLTGDRASPAQAAGRALGVFDQIAAEQLPADKARWIETARSAGHHVAMIGDGINDGPALAAADVGLAVCRSGNELAGEAGDVLLLGDPLRPLPGLLRLSRALVENIRQSIYWFALGANGLGVVACSLGWISPVTGAVFHETSSLLVMLNALRLLWFDDRSTATQIRLQARIPSLVDWAERLSPGRLLTRMIRRWQVTLQWVVCGAIAAWVCSQIILVRDKEAVIVLRGGRHLTTLAAGWSWRWPWPMERLIRLRPSEVQSVTVGFREKTGAANSASDRRGDLEWTSAHDGSEFRAAPDESLYLTGDEVAVEITADVQYRIANAEQFALAGSLQPAETIRAAAEAVLRSVIAAETLDDVLTEQRPQIEQRCREQLQRRLAEYRLGIEILEFDWLDVHPPRPVVDAYRHVSDAWEQREQAVNEAQAQATRTLYGTAGETAIRELEQNHAAKGPDQPAWTLTQEDWQRLSTPDADGQRIITGTAGAILSAAEAAAEQRRQSAIGQAARLRSLLAAAQGQPDLSRSHLYWTAVIEALAGKPFTLIDPALSGRRQIYLGDLPGNPLTLPPPRDPEK